MSLSVVFLSGADADLQDIFNYFEDSRDGMGREFMLAVDAYLSRIAVFPKIAPVYAESIRRQVMQRFPYGIFYEADASRVFVVLAILDLRMGDEFILRRLGWR